MITLCEVKFRQRVGKQVIAEVERKIAALGAFRDHSVERILICASLPSGELRHEGYFDRILTAEDLATR